MSSFPHSHTATFSPSASTPPCNSRNDRDVIAVLEFGLFLVHETDVLFVDVYIDEPPDLASVREPLLHAGIVLLQFIDQFLNVLSAAFHFRLAVREFLKR